MTLISLNTEHSSYSNVFSAPMFNQINSDRFFNIFFKSVSMVDNTLHSFFRIQKKLTYVDTIKIN